MRFMDLSGLSEVDRKACMKSFQQSLLSLTRVFGWLPQIVKLSQNRYRAQVRLFALAALVGLVAGVGAVGFYAATRVAEHYLIGVIAGYYPEPPPAGESKIS